MGMTQATSGSAAVNGFDVNTQMGRVRPPPCRAVLGVLCAAPASLHVLCGADAPGNALVSFVAFSLPPLLGVRLCLSQVRQSLGVCPQFDILVRGLHGTACSASDLPA